MSASIRAGDLLKMRAWAISGNQASVNTVYYQVQTITGSITLLEAATAFDGLVAPLYKAILGSQAQYRGIQCYVNQVPLPLPGISILGAGVGTGGSVNLPTQSCGITSWQTNYTGPSLRGRSYWPFPTTTEDAAGGAPTAGYITALTALSNAILVLTTLTGGSGSATVFLTLKRGKDKAGVLQPNEPINNFVVQPKWATQKRRGIGYGRPNASPI